MQYLFLQSKADGSCHLLRALTLTPPELRAATCEASICAVFPIAWKSRRHKGNNDSWLECAEAAHARCQPGQVLGVGPLRPIRPEVAGSIAFHLSAACASLVDGDRRATAHPTRIAELMVDWLADGRVGLADEPLAFVGELETPINAPAPVQATDSQRLDTLTEIERKLEANDLSNVLPLLDLLDERKFRLMIGGELDDIRGRVLLGVLTYEQERALLNSIKDRILKVVDKHREELTRP